MPAFLADAGLGLADVRYSDYDGALTLDEHHGGDLEIVSLDFDRYHGRMEPRALIDWLLGHLQAMRSVTTGPALITNWPGDGGSSAPSTHGSSRRYAIFLAHISVT
jgi:hypothetical protein